MSTPTIEKRAAHVLDEVIVTLDGLRAKTKAEPVREDLARCIATCERVQTEFAQFVELAAKIDAGGDKVSAAKERLTEAMMLEPGTPLPELLDGAATVIRYAAEGQEVPQ